MTTIQEVTEPIPRCDHHGMYMPKAWLIKHKQTAIYNKVTDMWIRRRDVDMAERCGDMEFGLY